MKNNPDDPPVWRTEDGRYLSRSEYYREFADPKENTMVAHTKAEAPAPVAAKPPPAPKELTVAERAQALLDHVVQQAKHGAPISPYIVDELISIVGGMHGHKRDHA